ncbi:MAG: hypothetical protein ACKN9W_07415, partial [Methylococcus sp.]
MAGSGGAVGLDSGQVDGGGSNVLLADGVTTGWGPGCAGGCNAVHPDSVRPRIISVSENGLNMGGAGLIKSNDMRERLQTHDVRHGQAYLRAQVFGGFRISASGGGYNRLATFLLGARASGPHAGQ